MTGAEALHKIPAIVAAIKETTKPELVAKIPVEAEADEYWMDWITPEMFFATESHVWGFVYNVLRQYWK